jgi:hypothetical protein
MIRLPGRRMAKIVTIDELRKLMGHAFLDGVIAGATEWYGPTMTTHRKS